MKIKFQTIILAVVWIGATFGKQEKMAPTIKDYERSATCLSGKITVYMKVVYLYSNELGSTVIFEVIGQTTGWIGMGFSTSGNMTGADIFVGWVKSGNVTITERKATGNGFPTLKSEQRVTEQTGSELDGLTRMTFSTQLNMTLRQIVFRYKFEALLCAYGNNDPTGDDISEYDYHGINNRGFTCFGGFFFCQDHSECFLTAYFCDGNEDCRDGSDEYNYDRRKNGRECDGKDFFASSKRCLLPERYVCDGNTDCVDESDELMCDQQSKTGYLDSTGFRCLKDPGQVKPITQMCDGVFDCVDLTDECICERHKRPSVCSRINIVVQSEISQHFVCKVENSSTHYGVEKICDNVNNCKTGIDEKNCGEVKCSERIKRGKNITEDDKCGFRCNTWSGLYATRFDGIFECSQPYDEECGDGCKNPPKICGEGRDGLAFYCENEKGIRIQILNSKICDGVKDCPDGIDELDCQGRFYCANETFKHIPIKQECDHRMDCDDGSDELNCSFFCNDSGSIKVIDPNKVCDGTFDCKEGSDECLTECIKSAFSSVKSLIANRVLLITIWILSLVAFIGNLSVAVYSIREFSRFKKEDNVIKKLNKSLVFNLSLSDLLVGIYLISICIQNLINEGEYCFIDRDWRSGIKCSILGAVLLIGSEQSVFTMIIITGLRLYTIVRPMRKINICLIILLVILSWITSISLAIIPLIPQTQDYFVDSIRYQDNQLFSIIEREDVEYYTKWLLLTNKHVNESEHFGYIGSWSLLEHLIGKLSKNYTVHGRFGYYSKHGVCVAPLFPDPKKDTSWIYTFLILSVNFLSFLFISAGYVAIYWINKKQRRRVQKKPDANMQKKIARIIVTDFFCWMPICIMGMLQVSGIQIPHDTYVFVGMILIPINSALNPFLYSDAPEYIWQKTEPLRAWIYRHYTAVKNSVINSCGMSNEDQRGVHVEAIEMRVIEEVGN